MKFVNYLGIKIWLCHIVVLHEWRYRLILLWSELEDDLWNPHTWHSSQPLRPLDPNKFMIDFYIKKRRKLGTFGPIAFLMALTALRIPSRNISGSWVEYLKKWGDENMEISPSTNTIKSKTTWKYEPVFFELKLVWVVQSILICKRQVDVMIKLPSYHNLQTS